MNALRTSSQRNFLLGLAAGLVLAWAVGSFASAGSISALFSWDGSAYKLDGANIKAATVDTAQLKDGAVTDQKVSDVSYAKVTGKLVTGSVSGDARTANSGNFGVGTATPSEKLEVAGKVKASAVQTTCFGPGC